MRFQIEGRVCLIGAITFGVASVLIVLLIHPVVESGVTKFFAQEKSRKLCIMSFCIIVLDIVLASIRAYVAV